MSEAVERFSPAWMEAVVARWNADPEQVDRCARAGLEGPIEIGLDEDESARASFVIADGRLSAGAGRSDHPRQNPDVPRWF